jgi:tartrate-resistant acid phosphatase type 5
MNASTTRKNALRISALVATCGTLVLACAGAPQGAQKQPSGPPSVGFLVVGDTGYDYDFLAKKDYSPALDREQFIEKEREEWIEDGLPPAEFTPPVLHRLERTGGYVAASGMWPVSRAMQRYCRRAECAFATMAGDNIYPDGATAGADGVDDERRFRQVFTEPFGTLGGARKDFAIYVALGNHDWRTSREGAMAQVRFHERNRPFYMDGLFYKVTPPAAHGLVDLFVIDTEVLLAGTTVYEDKLAPDGSEIETQEVVEPRKGAVPQTDAERAMAQWLDDALRTSTAPWKIVMAHHPFWSSSGGKFQQARTLRRLLLPSLCRYADMYLAGHEHTLELHLDDCSTTEVRRSAPLLNVVSGAGSKERPLHRPFARAQQQKYPQLRTIWAKGMTWGFSHITLQGDVATVRMYSVGSDPDRGPTEEFTYEYRRRPPIAIK